MNNIKTRTIFIAFIFSLFATSIYSQTITLNIAIQKDDVNQVRSFAEKGVDLNDIDRYGNTALNIACYNGNMEIIRILVDYGANINKKDRRGSNPIIIAAFKGSYEITEYLINQGADVDETDKAGRNALINAIISSGETSKNIDIIKIIAESSFDLNETDNMGFTALDYAKHYDIIFFLQSMGAIKGKEVNGY